MITRLLFRLRQAQFRSLYPKDVVNNGCPFKPIKIEQLWLLLGDLSSLLPRSLVMVQKKQQKNKSSKRSPQEPAIVQEPVIPVQSVAVVEKKAAVVAAPVAVPSAYVPFNFDEPPKHLELIAKKSRALKKKLRKIAEVEQAVSQGSKKVSDDQRASLLTKDSLERNLRELEEIKASVEEWDFTGQLRLVRFHSSFGFPARY